jgi:hypothetical protein
MAVPYLSWPGFLFADDSQRFEQQTLSSGMMATAQAANEMKLPRHLQESDD